MQIVLKQNLFLTLANLSKSRRALDDLVRALFFERPHLQALHSLPRLAQTQQSHIVTIEKMHFQIFTVKQIYSDSLLTRHLLSKSYGSQSMKKKPVLLAHRFAD